MQRQPPFFPGPKELLRTEPSSPMARGATRPQSNLCISHPPLRPAWRLEILQGVFCWARSRQLYSTVCSARVTFLLLAAAPRRESKNREISRCQLKLRTPVLAGESVWVSTRSPGGLWGNAGEGQHGAHIYLRPRGRTAACWGGESQVGTSAARLFFMNPCKVSEETAPRELSSTGK